ncbi:hypothetical protein [Mucisphaera calidilacus]|uniref:Uncharacterized protein n=1 Tax=Mucisphaera calidilacus TaxID=2527982 RepID=A0A518BZP0_9BACT|nr:hypothetical protein [Mucisphaera calidilacus]QDU72434.1 hypothetical protein Pan265_22990 [Mucisphaera calidilacus]
MRVAVVLMGLMIGACVLTGCARHQLRGVVVAGSSTGYEVVSVDALPAQGLANARVEVVLHPSSLDRRVLPAAETTHNGRFAFEPHWFDDDPVYLDIDAEIHVSAPGMASLTERITIPRGGDELLIRLADPNLPGSRVGEDDLYREALRHREAFERR